MENTQIPGKGHTLVSFPDGAVAYTCSGGDTVLLAGLRAGWNLPYECASGGCGTCKVTLVDGEVEHLWSEASGLTARDYRRGNRILACQSRPVDDITIKPLVTPEQRDDAIAPPPSRRPARIAVHDKLSDDTLLLTLDCGRPVPYLAGQFVVLEFPDGTRRAYSMAVEPAQSRVGFLELLVREKPGGAASGWLFDRVDVGEQITVEGPYGKAYAQSPADRPVVCIGGGSGLGPVLAIAEHSLTEAPARPVSLFLGMRSDKDVVLADRITALRDRGAEVVVAVEKDDPDAVAPPWGPSRPGQVVDVLAAAREDLGAHDVYAAGPAGMVDALLATFVRSGRAAADHVFFDRFST